MNGFGSTSTGAPPTPSRDNAIDPSARCHGTRPPPTVTVKDHDDAAAPAASAPHACTPSPVPPQPRPAPGPPPPPPPRPPAPPRPPQRPPPTPAPPDPRPTTTQRDSPPPRPAGAARHPPAGKAPARAAPRRRHPPRQQRQRRHHRSEPAPPAYHTGHPSLAHSNSPGKLAATRRRRKRRQRQLKDATQTIQQKMAKQLAQREKKNSYPAVRAGKLTPSRQHSFSGMHPQHTSPAFTPALVQVWRKDPFPVFRPVQSSVAEPRRRRNPRSDVFNGQKRFNSPRTRRRPSCRETFSGCSPRHLRRDTDSPTGDG